jgi:UDP-glucose 4-epimerase
MKILFTGGSSFTGYWFIKALASAGHDVVAIFRRRPNEYPDDLRRNRVSALTNFCRPVFGVSFGDDRFLGLIGTTDWDLLCNHGAEVANYKSPDFNVAAAVQNNTYRLPTVLSSLKNVGCSKIVFTGSVFENDEGAGSSDLRAFSPYGLSKGLTWQMFRYYAQAHQVTLGKFVIPNPFGPYEEPRFTHYLVKSWFAGKIAAVNTPCYVRDNIHVSLLAKIYARFSTTLAEGISRINPSGYVESQGEFTHRFAIAMRRRLSLECQFELKTQTDLSEPHTRINTDHFDAKMLDWCEKTAWDELADYYIKMSAATR